MMKNNNHRLWRVAFLPAHAAVAMFSMYLQQCGAALRAGRQLAMALRSKDSRQTSLHTALL